MKGWQGSRGRNKGFRPTGKALKIGHPSLGLGKEIKEKRSTAYNRTESKKLLFDEGERRRGKG